jgi:hypothetical protein
MKIVRKPVSTTVSVEPGAASACHAPDPSCWAWQSM